LAPCHYADCFAQNATNQKNGMDKASIDQLLMIAKEHPNQDSSFRLYNEALQKSIAANYAHGILAALNGIGFCYVDKGDYLQSQVYFKKALSYSANSGNKRDPAACNNNVGVSYFYLGDYNKASEYYYKALSELKNVDSLTSTAAVNTYNNLAVINMRLNQNDKSLSFLRTAEDISRKRNYAKHLAMTLNNEANIFSDDSLKRDSALICYFELQEIGKKNGFDEIEAYAVCNIGDWYLDARQFNKAVPYLQHGVALSQNKFASLYINAGYNLGLTWYNLGKYQAAETIILSVLRKARAANQKDQIISKYAALSNIYRATGEYEKALECMDSVVVLKDSLFSTGKTKAINELDIKYKTSEKDKQLAQNQLLIANQNSKIAKKNIWMISIGSGVLLLLLVSVGGFIHKQRLQAERIKLLEQESKIGILKAAVQSEDNERSRLARELHDGIGGMLSAAMMRLSTMHHKNEAITQAPAYREAMDILSEMGDEIRKTSHNLMPEVLLKQNLPEAVRTYCSNVEEGGALQIDFQSFGSFDDLTEKLKLNVYRIVQELLKNITQHAQAQHAFVQLLKNENNLTISIEDDGIGFNTSELRSGIGLHNLQTRVNSLDGNVTIESSPGKGTSVIIEFNNLAT
jgi:two-component system, NarL family, sensor kinase